MWGSLIRPHIVSGFCSFYGFLLNVFNKEIVKLQQESWVAACRAVFSCGWETCCHGLHYHIYWRRTTRRYCIYCPGYVLIESIIAALFDGYNISYQKDEIIEFMAKELVHKPDYTRYLRVPISQEEVTFNLLNLTTSKKYSRVVADMYLLAISSALDLHIRTIQNISGYFAVVNTLPLNTKPGDSKKVITLIIKDGIYQPIVKIPNEETQMPSSPLLHQ